MKPMLILVLILTLGPMVACVGATAIADCKVKAGKYYQFQTQQCDEMCLSREPEHRQSCWEQCEEVAAADLDKHYKSCNGER